MTGGVASSPCPGGNFAGEALPLSQPLASRRSCRSSWRGRWSRWGARRRMRERAGAQRCLDGEDVEARGFGHSDEPIQLFGTTAVTARRVLHIVRVHDEPRPARRGFADVWLHVRDACACRPPRDRLPSVDRGPGARCSGRHRRRARKQSAVRRDASRGTARRRTGRRTKRDERLRRVRGRSARFRPGLARGPRVVPPQSNSGEGRDVWQASSCPSAWIASRSPASYMRPPSNAVPARAPDT